jgi:hypothetical protein
MRKNVNPKTLKGQDKLNRMLDLMGRMNTLNESKSYSELELIKKGPNGIVYGIIRENHDYFIKTSNKTSGRFLAEDFSYIGGLQNKYDERYKSYAEAIKHLNMKFDMLNESYGIENNTNIFESDGVAFGGGVGFGFVMEEEDEVQNEGEKEIISDVDADLEEEKKVLKVDTPKVEEPVEDEVEDESGIDMGGDIADIDFGEEDSEGDMGVEGMEDEEGDDNTKKIQKYTGKIGQMLRDMDKVDSDLEKYVINSIISAMHLDEMDEGDKEDIIAKLEGEEGEEGDDNFDMESGDEEVDEFDMESTEETPEEGGEELSEGKEEKGKELEITPDMIAMLLKKGECDCDGHKLVYKSKEKNEGRVFSKKQLMESFLRRETKKSLKKVIKERRELCEQCGERLTEGMCVGCDMNEHHNMSYTNYGKFDRDEYMMGEELIGNQKRIDKNKNGRIDAEDFKILRKGRKDRRRNIGEEDMSVMDAIATGQGYLSATNDLDRDFDGIPNRLDMDSNNDGKLDFEMGRGDDFIELDIDFLRNSGAPVKDPGIKEPSTKPGEGDKWRRIKRPKVDPRPKAKTPNSNMGMPKPSYRRRGMFR